MDAVDFIKVKRRICMEFKTECSECPAFHLCGERLLKATQEKMAKGMEAVEEWKKRHPKKTKGEALLECWPNAMETDGYPDICPRYIDTTVECSGETNCIECEKRYWTEEIE